MKKFFEEVSIFIELLITFAIVAAVVAIPAYFIGIIDNPVIFIVGNAILFATLSTYYGIKGEIERKKRMKNRFSDDE